MIMHMNFMAGSLITSFLVLIIFYANTHVHGDGVAELIKKGDEYYSEFANLSALAEYEKAFEQKPDDFEIITKLTRSYNDVGEDYKEEESAEAEEYFEKGYRLAELMKEKYPQRSETYFYLAATRGNLALFRGGKDKVRLGRDVEQYAKKALELDPYYGPAYVALGVYYREVANLNWFLKKFAKAFFGGLPEGTNEDSLIMLLKAQELLPQSVYVQYELGKTYREIGDEEKMKEHFEKALLLPNTDHRDKYFKMRIKDYLYN